MPDATNAAYIGAVIAGLFTLLGGGIAAWGAWYAVKAGVNDLEATERRRQKISCVINLYGLRYVLSPDQVQRDEDRTRFMFEIGRAGALFADDMEVQKKLRDFYNAVTAQNQMQREIADRQQAGAPDPQDAGRVEGSSRHTTDLLVALIKELSRSANFPVQSVSDSDVRSIFTMNLANPAGLSTLILNAQQGPQPPNPVSTPAFVQQQTAASNASSFLRIKEFVPVKLEGTWFFQPKPHGREFRVEVFRYEEHGTFGNQFTRSRAMVHSLLVVAQALNNQWTKRWRVLCRI